MNYAKKDLSWTTIVAYFFTEKNVSDERIITADGKNPGGFCKNI